MTLYVATDGSDSWTGTIAEPSGSDGPLATLVGARNKIRQLKGAGDSGPFEVLVREGVYYESQTLELYKQDSGTAGAPITYKAYPGEKPLISGGRKINQLTQDINGNYTVNIPQAANHQWKFRQLFIDDMRYTLAKSPNQDYYYVQGIPPTPASPYYGEPYWFSHNFIYKPGDLKNWSTLADDDISITTYHLWEASTVILSSVNETDNTAFTETHMLWGYTPSEDISAGGISKRYIVHNAPDSLDDSGEWYLDRTNGQLTVIPFASEDLSSKTVIAPVTKNAIKFIGNADADYFIEYINFEGLTFSHYATPVLNGGLNGGWRTHQGAAGIDSCIDATAARCITFESCEVSHIGTHVIEFKRGCTDNTIQQCHFWDIGGGGVYIGERIRTVDGYTPGMLGETGNNTIYNNYIHDAGIVHNGAMGILIGQSPDNTISHNEIAYINQCGIQIGWNWDTSLTWHSNNIIEYNHIHDIGQNVSSDLAAIYTVGDNQNTIVRNNKIHDVYAWMEGNGKGLYPDENTNGVVFEKNLVYDVGAYGLGVNYCRDITVHNNIFAMNHGKAPFMFGHIANASITNNIFYYYYGNVYSDNNDWIRMSWFVECDNNLYWRIGGKPVMFQKPSTDGQPVYDRVDFAQWKSLTGLDGNSKVADPLFSDPENRDFSFKSDTNAAAVGFETVDWSQSGLEGTPEWKTLPGQFDKKTRYPVYFEKWHDYKFSIDGINDSFENSMTGASPKNAIVYYAGTGNAVAEITEDRACQGTKCLKIQSDQGMIPSIEYYTYDPIIYSGKGRFTCQVYKGPGASISIDFYSDNAGVSNKFANVDIYPTGQLATAFGNALAVVPDNTWVRVDIDFGVGSESQISYFLRLTVDDSTLFAGDITNPNALPDNLRKIKIGSFTDNSTFFVDNLGVKLDDITNGDYNNDNFIDIKDFALFARSLLYQQDISYYDREAITYTTFDDILEIAQNWLRDRQEINTTFFSAVTALSCVSLPIGRVFRKRIALFIFLQTLSYDIIESWQFDLPAGSGATFLSGINNNQALLTGQADWQGDSFSFDGSTYFSVSKTEPSYNIDLSGDFTIKANVKTTQASTGTIWAKLDTAWEPGAKQLFISDGFPTFDSGWIATIPATSRVNDGNWHEIKVAYKKSNNQIGIYIDGAISVYQQLPSNMSQANDDFDFIIGAQSELPGGERYGGFEGNIKEIIVFK